MTAENHREKMSRLPSLQRIGQDLILRPRGIADDRLACDPLEMNRNHDVLRDFVSDTDTFLLPNFSRSYEVETAIAVRPVTPKTSPQKGSVGRRFPDTEPPPPVG